VITEIRKIKRMFKKQKEASDIILMHDVRFTFNELSIHSTHFTLLMSYPDGKKSYSDITV
jgi:hypothetical protein